MIAEPWDIGPDGYQLGRFPVGWLEWNDRYRDDVRRFWRGDAGMAGPLATRMMGSSDIFAGQATRTVNFLATHDGFTLADTVAYAHKHNDANGENNRDGHNENFSWNNGSEGPSVDPGIQSRRQADQRALLATLFASRGTIQLTAGDEFGHSQQGNNNAYAQDNEITWLDWESRDQELEKFAQQCAERRHAMPELSDIRFLGRADWYDLHGNRMTSESWRAAEGFEVHIAREDGGVLSIRIDRQGRSVSIDTRGPASSENKD
jgi:glycogen operon protein